MPIYSWTFYSSNASFVILAYGCLPKEKEEIPRGTKNDSGDDDNGTPKKGKQTPAKLKDSYVLQVADLATLEGLCIGAQSYLRLHV